MRGTKQPVSVLVVIHTRDLQVLVLERAAHPGLWQSVTGSREGDESLLETACREVAEETGITCSPDDLCDWHIHNTYEIFPNWRHRYPDGVTHNTEHVFSLALAQHHPVKLSPTEHRDYAWLSLSEAAERCFSWSNRDAIQMLGIMASKTQAPG